MPTNRLIVKEEVAVYAAVLFDGAFEAGGQEAVLEVRDQMVRVAEAMRTNMELSVALSDPGYTPEQRGELARNVFAGCNPVLLDVLAVLAERGDAALLPRVLENYAERRQGHIGRHHHEHEREAHRRQRGVPARPCPQRAQNDYRWR